jgi:hypothetical protein
MSQQSGSLLPRFGCSFDFGEAGTIVPFYVENGVAKSGHVTHGDWTEDVLSDTQLAKINHSEQRKGFKLGLIDHRDRVLLIFPGDVNDETIIFWEALSELCSGRFYSKFKYFHAEKKPLLSAQDLQTLEQLQRFFSYETNFGEEKCDTLFDADRNVFVRRLHVAPNKAPDLSMLGKAILYPDYITNTRAIKKAGEQFLRFAEEQNI